MNFIYINKHSINIIHPLIIIYNIIHIFSIVFRSVPVYMTCFGYRIIIDSKILVLYLTCIFINYEMSCKLEWF